MFAGQFYSIVKLFDHIHLKLRRNRNGNQYLLRLSIHGIYIRKINHYCLVAQVPEGCINQIEMNAFSKYICGYNQIFIATFQHSSIITNSFKLVLCFKTMFCVSKSMSPNSPNSEISLTFSVIYLSLSIKILLHRSLNTCKGRKKTLRWLRQIVWVMLLK